MKTEILQTFESLKRKLSQGDRTVKKFFHGHAASDEFPDQSQQSPGGCMSQGSDTNALTQISQLYQMSGQAKIGPVRK